MKNKPKLSYDCLMRLHFTFAFGPLSDLLNNVLRGTSQKANS